MIKAIFFDVDGTLVSHNLQNVPDSARKGLHKLTRKGISIILATGRTISELLDLPTKDIKFNAYITLNGQLVLDETRHVIAGTPIDAGEMEVLAQTFISKHIPFKFIDEHGSYINYVNDTVISTQESTMGAIPNVGIYNGEKIYQIVAFVSDRERKILEETLDECSITSWNATGIDIIPKEGGKASGIKNYLEINHLRREEVMAFGDGENDIDMLKYAGIGVAMGNASIHVKNSADYVTDTVDNDGILKALKHFELID
ncbi:MAG: Cof-type HAD-IIB family hydrolase [Erysipelotrichia bacterium]|nr:Cof-type HAD-IIB family hydrolase [Erysipelotrichia bacterium]